MHDFDIRAETLNPRHLKRRTGNGQKWVPVNPNGHKWVLNECTISTFGWPLQDILTFEAYMHESIILWLPQQGTGTRACWTNARFRQTGASLAFTRYSYLRLHKIFLPSRLLCTNQSTFCCPSPTCIAYRIAILLHDYCAVYPPTTPILYAIHHTLLVMAVSCEGQAPVGLYTILPLAIFYDIYCNKGESGVTNILRSSVGDKGRGRSAQEKGVFAQNIIDSCTKSLQERISCKGQAPAEYLPLRSFWILNSYAVRAQGHASHALCLAGSPMG